ncbi:undecaprenyl diphosphate synthase family protein [Anaerotignum propionicum]|uniref:Isoprenyl transferase n=1 Tax=Anaerotignum propionicum DSM 1682 TaxID=991789 RepID=A0A0X8V9L5_ANAPI|nr:undecaprenyl diphosphate synthase family protein [Anaerotignum propionicum]AMJ39965.1 isoprenyl transferase [Anaerotignum propionicum DSM 1682]SHE27065.1 undecaprenyl diphosphate synthase [[Clostridium] propionicum DSM 1682] [Anaerotignum propionicum DSM 1682]
MRIPKHIGIIPDGNRRWAVENGLEKKDGYDRGLNPGLELYKLCKEMGVKEISYYGFTVDNTKRPTEQRLSFTNACVDAVKLLSGEDAELLVLGNADSKMFPEELLPYTKRRTFGKGGMKLNFLVNYSWEWDTGFAKNNLMGPLQSQEVSRVDLVIRWGGRKRLSGFLPLQSVYSDFYFIDDFWPDFKKEHLEEAIGWYSKQEISLGG